MIIKLLGDLATFLLLFLRPQGALAAENLFLPYGAKNRILTFKPLLDSSN